MSLIRKIKSLALRCYIKLREKTFGAKLKYIFVPEHSDSLLIIFSGFSPGNERRYNYIRSFSGLKIDKLYILDPYGYRGSYHLYENGSDYPQRETQGLIDKFKGKYKHIFMAGSSKGGTIALFYGLRNEVEAIFSGACQYNLGTYLSSEVHKDILNSMVGGQNVDKNVLDNIIRNLIVSETGHRSKVFVLYSKNEPTYDEEIKDLLHDLYEHHYDVTEKVENFIEHGEVGKYFPSFVKRNITINTIKE